MTEKEHCSLEQGSNIINIVEKLDLNSKYPGRIKKNRQIFEKYKDKFDNISEFIYYYKNPIEAHKRRYCRMCGEKNKYDDSIKKYSQYCSCKCANSDPTGKEQRRKTCLAKYGVDNIFKDKEKIKQAVHAKYGVDNIFQDVERIRKATKEKYGVEYICQNPNIKKKIKETCLQKYGVECSLHNKEIAQKVKQKFLEKYQSNTYMQSDDFKKKTKNTNSLKYGKQYYSQTDECKEKVYNSLKENHTFVISKPEQQVGELLKKKFAKVESQYKSTKYPFRCDYYIVDIDTYIECNYYFAHGKEPFDNNNEQHKQLLEKWMLLSKTHPKYIDAIQVWTQRDVKKLETARKNNLNYLMFWDKDLTDFYSWYNNI